MVAAAAAAPHDPPAPSRIDGLSCHEQTHAGGLVGCGECVYACAPRGDACRVCTFDCAYYVFARGCGVQVPVTLERSSTSVSTPKDGEDVGRLFAASATLGWVSPPPSRCAQPSSAIRKSSRIVDSSSESEGIDGGDNPVVIARFPFTADNLYSGTALSNCSSVRRSCRSSRLGLREGTNTYFVFYRADNAKGPTQVRYDIVHSL